MSEIEDLKQQLAAVRAELEEARATCAGMLTMLAQVDNIDPALASSLGISSFFKQAGERNASPGQTILDALAAADNLLIAARSLDLTKIGQKADAYAKARGYGEYPLEAETTGTQRLTWVAKREGWDACTAENSKPQTPETCHATPPHPVWALTHESVLQPVVDPEKHLSIIRDVDFPQQCSICTEIAKAWDEARYAARVGVKP